MFPSDHYITTLVTISQAVNYRHGNSIYSQNGDNKKMGRKKKSDAPALWPNNIATLSKERDWSQADLARETGFTPQEITRWWNGGRELHQSHIMRFAKTFQCPDGDILNSLPAARDERELLKTFRHFNETTKARYLGMAEGLKEQSPQKTETTKSASSSKKKRHEDTENGLNQ